MKTRMKLSINESEFFSGVRADNVSAVIEALRPEPYLVNFQDEMGKTPLWVAVESGLVEMVKVLITHGASIEVADPDGNGLLHLAIEKCLNSYGTIRKNSIEIATILLNSGINVNTNNGKGFSCLHSAAASGDKEIVSFLLEHGADVLVRSHEGFTAFHWSLCANIWERDIPKYLQTLDVLIHAGTDVNAVTDDGRTALAIAKEMNLRPQFLKFLQERGAK
jgi:ankyrin repeat protein